MIRFLIYLFESGMCLTMLFLVYFLFLRKETYFTFNRIYLISILVFSLMFPLVHFSFLLTESQALQRQAEGIKEFRNYYEHIISMTDPDYSNSFTTAFDDNNNNETENAGFGFTAHHPPPATVFSEINNSNIKTGFWAQINWARLILSIYLLGILFFMVRLILLFRWIGKTIKKYGSTAEGDFKMVKMDEDVPPFSFFRFIFLNTEVTSLSEYEQILAHEKVHIRQCHSVDLLLAHFITVFQWFNPFAWFINKAMKTNHEYIADHNVVAQGYKLFDYQSLLLKQMISIRSVELVNNFNLINIKKRIAMMTKIKSGLAAQIKALVVIPAAIFLFFFFAEISFAQTTAGIQNKDLSKEIQGFWENTDVNAYGQLLNFKGNEIQILENVNSYKDFTFDFKSGTVSMTRDFFETSELRDYSKNINDWAVMTVHPENENSKFFFVLIKNENLYILWNSNKPAIYKRVSISNSLEPLFKDFTDDFTPVSTSYFRTIDNPEKTFRILMNNKGEMMMNNDKVTLNQLREKINRIRTAGNPFDDSEKIPVIMIDGACKMQNVNALYNKMREINELRYIVSVRPKGKNVPEVFYHNIGIPRLLPPKDAIIMDEKAVEKSGMKIHRVDLTKDYISPEWVARQFGNEIQENQKYLILYSYSNETSYREYISILDEIYRVIFAKRDLLARQKFDLNYDELAKAQQKDIQKIYPLTLTERNIDQPE